MEVTDVVTKRPANPIISAFNPDTYESFVRSVSPVQFVFPIGKVDPKVELVYVDVKPLASRPLSHPSRRGQTRRRLEVEPRAGLSEMVQCDNRRK